MSRQQFGRSLPPEVLLWSGGLCLLGALWVVLLRGQFHLLVAIAIGFALLAIARVDKVSAILLIFAYLFLMGDLRRIVSLVEPQPAFDPLLLIGPLCVSFLAFPRLLQLRLRDNLSKAMLALLVIMTLEIANPAQGSLGVGLSGAFFYIVPVLWFWVGRSYASPALVERLLYGVVIPLATLAALFGLYQTFVGFPAYQQVWIQAEATTLTSLHVSGSAIRSFGFSVSGAEYATLLMFGCVLTLTAFFVSRRAWILLLPLLGTALLLDSSRGVVVKLVVASGITWVLRRGQRIKPVTIVGMAVAGALALAALSTVAAHFSTAPAAPEAHSTAAQDELSHQLGGLGHPLDARYSTAGQHAGMVSDAIMLGITHPLGMGLGASTFAAQKFLPPNTAGEGSSEVDMSDMFSSLGVVGGSVYLLVILLALRRCTTYSERAPRRVSLPVFGLLLATIGSWLVGGQYSTSALLFFLVGALAYRDGLPVRTLDVG